MDTDSIKNPESGSGKKGPLLFLQKYFWLTLLFFSTTLMAVLVASFDQALSVKLRTLHVSGGFLIFFSHLAELMKYFGRGDVLFILGCILAVHRMKKAAVLACLALLLTSPMVFSAKCIFERGRPDGTDLQSFPSGDAAAISGFLVPIAALHPAFKPIAVASVIIIGTGRVILGKHYPSDVFAGIAIGLLAGAIVLSFRIPFRPKIRRMIQRKWLAVILGFTLLATFLLGVPVSLKRFLDIFGPAVGLLIVIPFIRPWARTLKQAKDYLTKTRKRIIVAGTLTILLACLLFSASSSSLWNRKEVRLARTTIEMVHSKNYIAPASDGQSAGNTPMLIYWLMSIPTRIFGQTELACRLIASLSVVFACFLTFHLGLQLFGWNTGFLAMLILSTTPMLFMEGSIATTDTIRLALMVLAYDIFEAGLRNGLKWIHRIGLTLAMSAIALTGNPSMLVILVLGMMIILVFTRKHSLTWGVTLLGCVFIAMAIFLFRAIPATQAEGNGSLLQGIGVSAHQFFIGLQTTAWKNILLSLFLYVPVMVLIFFPWTLFLPAATSSLILRRGENIISRLFLLGWMIPAFIFTGLFSTKLPHSGLLILPALALASAAVIYSAGKNNLTSQGLIWLGRGRWLFGVIGFLGSLILIMGVGFAKPLGIRLPGFEPTGKCWSSSIAMGCVLFVMTIYALKDHASKRYRATVGILAAGFLGIIFTLILIVFPSIEQFKFPKRLAKTISSQMGTNVPVAAMNYNEPSLSFYLSGRPIRFIENKEEILTWAKETGAGVIILPRYDLIRTGNREKMSELKEIAAFFGFDYSTNRWLELVVLEKTRH